MNPHLGSEGARARERLCFPYSQLFKNMNSFVSSSSTIDASNNRKKKKNKILNADANCKRRRILRNCNLVTGESLKSILSLQHFVLLSFYRQFKMPFVLHLPRHRPHRNPTEIDKNGKRFGWRTRTKTTIDKHFYRNCGPLFNIIRKCAIDANDALAALCSWWWRKHTYLVISILMTISKLIRLQAGEWRRQFSINKCAYRRNTECLHVSFRSLSNLKFVWGISFYFIPSSCCCLFSFNNSRSTIFNIRR